VQTFNDAVDTISLVHFNSNNSPREEIALDIKLKGGYPVIDKLTLLIPENLDLDRILEEFPPAFKFKKDKFIYILDLIYSIPARKKKMVEDYPGFTPINKTILGSIIKDYRKYIDYLKARGIVEEDNYIVGEKSRGLKFTEKYQTQTKPIEITDWALIKNISYLRKKTNTEKTSQLIFMKKWFRGLEVDLKGATDYLQGEYLKDVENPNEKFPHLKLNSRLYPIQKLHREPDSLFFVDETAGRLHTYLTQLKSELRKFITYKGKRLCAIDITNSQPYLLLSLLDKKIFIRNNMSERIASSNPTIESQDKTIHIMLGVLVDGVSNEEDVNLFKEIVSSGNFYEKFGEILIENNEIEELDDPSELRKMVKEITFSTLFSENSLIRYLNSIKIFQRTFPNVYEVIKSIKENHHPTLAVTLQNLEADLVLHKACKIISEKKPDVPIFTLHDSIITTEENIEFVQSVLKNVLKENIGIAPNLKIERWE